MCIKDLMQTHILLILMKCKAERKRLKNTVKHEVKNDSTVPDVINSTRSQEQDDSKLPVKKRTGP